jgi:hypothetical protein
MNNEMNEMEDTKGKTTNKETETFVITKKQNYILHVNNTTNEDWHNVKIYVNNNLFAIITRLSKGSRFIKTIITVESKNGTDGKGQFYSLKTMDLEIRWQNISSLPIKLRLESDNNIIAEATYTLK